MQTLLKITKLYEDKSEAFEQELDQYAEEQLPHDIKAIVDAADKSVDKIYDMDDHMKYLKENSLDKIMALIS